MDSQLTERFPLILLHSTTMKIIIRLIEQHFYGKIVYLFTNLPRLDTGAVPLRGFLRLCQETPPALALG